jgi:hypothetical protein
MFRYVDQEFKKTEDIILVSKNPYPPDDLMDNTYPIRIFVPTER